MARRLLLRHPIAHAYSIEVAAKWPRSGGTRPPSEAALVTYRRHRQRLGDVLRPEPNRPSIPALLPNARPFRRAVRQARAFVEQVASHEKPAVSDLFAPDLLEAATALYDPTLPYHNADHALRAVAWGERLLRVCSQAGFRVDATVVRLALLFHDAGYGADLSAVGCPDAEAYAGALARRTLTGRVPAPVLEDVEAAILATRRTSRPDTPEGKVVRAADLADLAADYDTFAGHSEALRVEQEHLSGVPLSLAEWRESVDQLLTDYLEERLWPLELLDDVGQPGFHATAKANLRRYLM